MTAHGVAEIMRETRTGEATTPCAIGNPGAFIYDRDSTSIHFRDRG